MATRGEGEAVEPFWLPWHIDPNTISTLTGDDYVDFTTATPMYGLPRFANFSAPPGLGFCINTCAYTGDGVCVRP